jgi:outer membrane receptor protein involved in Fe transport
MTTRIDSRHVAAVFFSSAMLAAATVHAAPDDQATPPGSDADNTPAEVVVTGTRIGRSERDYVADSPIVTVNSDNLSKASQPTVDNMLQRLPQLTGSGGIGNGQQATSAGAGLATLNLRNLGDNRNLVLLDGRRMTPASNTFAVDVNSLPVGIIDNVEIITGGASAVYGSDAIAGVINFKLKHRFQGLQLDVHGGVADAGDYGNMNASLLGGSNIADGRGNLMVAFDYTKRNEVLQRDREFFQRSFQTGTGTWAFSFLSTGYYQPATGGAANLPNGAIMGAAVGAPVAISPTAVLGFNTSGTTLFTRDNPVYGYTSGLYPDNPLLTKGPNGIAYAGNYNNFATSPLERYSAFGRFEYEVNDSITAYAQTLFTHYQVQIRAMPPTVAQYWGFAVPRDANHPVPAAFATVLDSRPTPGASWFFERVLDGGPGAPFFPAQNATTQTFQTIAGLGGKLGLSDWTWDLYGRHGDSQIDNQTFQGTVINARYAQLMGAANYGANFVDPNTGNLACTSGISPFISQASITADCFNFLTGRLNSVVDQKQDVIEGSATGSLFDLPAGAFKMAIGADYRRNTYRSSIDTLLQPSSVPSAIGPCPVCSSIAGFNQVSNAGSTNVWEVYAEALIPIVKDLPLVKSLDVDLGYRYSNYQLSGKVDTYKGDLNWNVGGGLRFRGGYERAVRAPNPIELFGARAAVAGFNALDPCVNTGALVATYGNSAANPNQAKVQALCAALVPGSAVANFVAPYRGSGVAVLLGSLEGNANLDPEVADTITAGLVFSPDKDLFLDSRLSLSVDLYDIDLKGAIAGLTNTQSYQLCFNANGSSNPTYDPTSPYCQVIVRSPFAVGGQNVTVKNAYQNQGGIKTRGADLQVDWNLPLGPGRFDFNVLLNKLIKSERAVVSSAAFVDYKDSIDASGPAYYNWRSLITPSYTIGNTAVGVRWKHLPSVRSVNCVTAACLPPTDKYDLLDLFGTYQLGDSVRLTLGVDNVLDKNPPVVGGTPGNTNLGEYDLVGRAYWAGVRVTF